MGRPPKIYTGGSFVTGWAPKSNFGHQIRFGGAEIEFRAPKIDFRTPRNDIGATKKTMETNS